MHRLGDWNNGQEGLLIDWSNVLLRLFSFFLFFGKDDRVKSTRDGVYLWW